MEKLCQIMKRYWLVFIILVLSIGINYCSSKNWDGEVRIDVGLLSIITALADLATLFALIAVMFQIAIEKKKTKEEKIDNTFFNLVQMFNSILDELNQIEVKKLYSDSTGLKIERIESEANKSGMSADNIFGCIIQDIKEQKNERIKINHVKRQITYMRENLSDFQRKMNILEESDDATLEELIKTYSENFRGNNENEIDDTHFKEVLKIIFYNEQNPITRYKKLESSLAAYFKNVEEIKEEKLTKEEKEKIANEVFDFYYENLGRFTRLIHQITKFINDNVTSIEQKDIYFSTLRSTLSENELLTVFYFAFHSRRGSGLKQQLTNKTNLFGHDEELPLDESEELQYFKKSSLIYNEEDIKEMRKCQ